MMLLFLYVYNVCMYYVEAGASRDENADFARIHISYFFIPGQTSEWKFIRKILISKWEWI